MIIKETILRQLFIVQVNFCQAFFSWQLGTILVAAKINTVLEIWTTTVNE